MNARPDGLPSPRKLAHPPALYLKFAQDCGFNYIGISSVSSRVAFTKIRKEAKVGGYDMRWWNVEQGVWEDRGWKDAQRRRFIGGAA